jgi:hypothetical protein
VSRAGLAVVLGGSLLFGACFYEIGEPASVGGGGGGGGAGGAAGGIGGAGAGPGGGGSGAGGAPTAGVEIVITIDETAVGETMTDVPILVPLSARELDLDLAGDGGESLRFYTADGSTLLAHEIERWAPEGVSTVWVELPSLEAGAARPLTFLLRAGEPSPEPPLDPSEVWSAYLAVYHLADDISGDGSIIRDSSPTGLNALTTLIVDTDVVEAQLGLGLSFRGATGDTPHATVAGTTVYHVPPNGARTFEMWLSRSAAIEHFQQYIIGAEGCCLGQSISAREDGTLRSVLGVEDCCGGNPSNYTTLTANLPGGVADTGWHHLVVSFDRAAGIAISYLDGVEQGQLPITITALEGSGPFNLGSDYKGEVGFVGVLDEVRIAPTASSPAWVALQHASMSSSLLTFGPPTALPAP